MPQTTRERAARWPGMDTQAIEFLTRNGYLLNHDYTWTLPKNQTKPTVMEEDAIIYLIEEWDFGGYRDHI